MRSFTSTDPSFGSLAVAVGANAIGSSILFGLRRKYACIIFDAVFDIIYVGFNAWRFLMLDTENDEVSNRVPRRRVASFPLFPLASFVPILDSAGKKTTIPRFYK